MVEEILGKQQAEDMFCAAMLTGLMTEKQAGYFMESMEKDGFDLATVKKVLKSLGVGLGIVGGGARAGANAISKIPGIMGTTAALGIGAGAIGTFGLDALMKEISEEDPKAKLNAKLEAEYRSGRKELEDAEWMDRARAMRDELKRNGKRMDPAVYAKKFRELNDVLDSKRG